MMQRLARSTFRHHWVTIGAWIVAMIAIFALSGRVGTDFGGGLEIPDSESRDGFDVLEESFGGAGAGLTGSIVFQTEEGVDDPDRQGGDGEAVRRGRGHRVRDRHQSL